MKTLMTVVMLVSLLLATSTQACITGWIMGTPTEADNKDAEWRARLGLNMEDKAKVGDFDVGVPEFGLQVDWIGRGDFSRYGIYGLLHLRTEDEAATWAGRPYIGYSVDLAVSGNEDKGSAYGPVVGTRYAQIFMFEYQYATYAGKLDEVMDEGSDEHKLFVGLCLRY